MSDAALLVTECNPTIHIQRLIGISLSTLRPLGLSPHSTTVDSGFDILRHASSPCFSLPMDSMVCHSAKALWLWQASCNSQVQDKLNMFRISIADTPSQRTLVVEGDLIGPWVDELGTTWRNAGRGLEGRKLVIDLRSLTVISREGEEAIFDLMKKGAKFTCGGVLTRHVLKQLARKKQREAPRR